MDKTRIAKFQIGQVVRHRLYPFRGVIFDIDPEFNNTDEWYQSIPAERRPRKDQPFYHLFAENAESEYIAYVFQESPNTLNSNRFSARVREAFESLKIQARKFRDEECNSTDSALSGIQFCCLPVESQSRRSV